MYILGETRERQLFGKGNPASLLLQFTAIFAIQKSRSHFVIMLELEMDGAEGHSRLDHQGDNWQCDANLPRVHYGSIGGDTDRPFSPLTVVILAHI